METNAVCIGIDVSKAQLDVAQLPEGPRQVFAQTPRGIERLVAHVQSLNPSAIVLEATGGLEVAVASALAVAILGTDFSALCRSPTALLRCLLLSFSVHQSLFVLSHPHLAELPID